MYRAFRGSLGWVCALGWALDAGSAWAGGRVLSSADDFKSKTPFAFVLGKSDEKSAKQSATIRLVANKRYEFELGGMSAGRADLYLFGPDRKHVASNPRVGKTWKLRHVPDRSGEFQVVLLNLEESANHLELSVRMLEPPLADGAPFEIEPKSSEAVVLSLTPFQRVSIQVQSDVMSDLTINFVDPDGKPAPAGTSAILKKLPFDVLRGGKYRLEIDNKSLTKTNKVRVSMTASTYSAIELAKVTLKAGEHEEIPLKLPGGQAVSVWVESKEETDVDLIVYDAARREIASDLRIDKNCFVTFQTGEGGVFQLRLINLGSIANESRVTYSGPAKQ